MSRKRPGPILSVAQEFYRRSLEAYGNEMCDEDEGRLTALRAKIEYLSGNRNAAEILIDGRTDPSCLSFRLSIFIDQEVNIPRWRISSKGLHQMRSGATER